MCIGDCICIRLLSLSDDVWVNMYPTVADVVHDPVKPPGNEANRHLIFNRHKNIQQLHHLHIMANAI